MLRHVKIGMNMVKKGGRQRTDAVRVGDVQHVALYVMAKWHAIAIELLSVALTHELVFFGSKAFRSFFIILSCHHSDKCDFFCFCFIPPINLILL